ncbi:MAG: LPS export ABC transporter periplasmic protein LptC [Parvibaculales bacterium]
MGAPPPDEARATRDPRAHSRRIARLRLALAALAFILLAILILSPRGGPENILRPLGDMVLSGPVYRGLDGTGNAYELRAEQASRAGDDDNIVILNQISAELEADMPANRFSLRADRAELVRNSGRAALQGGIIVRNEAGSEMRFEQLNLNMDDGSLSSDRPLSIRTPQGHLQADNMQASRLAQEYRFGNVKIVLGRDKQNGQKSQE